MKSSFYFLIKLLKIFFQTSFPTVTCDDRDPPWIKCMLKLCGEFICKPLDLIFKSCIKQGKFLTEWKKANVVPVHKKGDKQILKNY